MLLDGKPNGFPNKGEAGKEKITTQQRLSLIISSR
jgi:hypothetical protein